jgi:hypothetical protein
LDDPGKDNNFTEERFFQILNRGTKPEVKIHPMNNSSLEQQYPEVQIINLNEQSFSHSGKDKSWSEII